MKKNQSVVGGAISSVVNLYFVCIFAMGGAIALVVCASMLTSGLELGQISGVELGFYFVGFVVSVAILLVSPAAREKVKLMVLYPFGLVLAAAVGSTAASTDGLPADPMYVAFAHSAGFVMYAFPVCISLLLFIRAYEDRVSKVKV